MNNVNNDWLGEFKRKQLRITVDIDDTNERKKLMHELGEVIHAKWRSGTPLDEYCPNHISLCWDEGICGNIAWSSIHNDFYKYVSIQDFIESYNTPIDLTSKDVEEFWQEVYHA